MNLGQLFFGLGAYILLVPRLGAEGAVCAKIAINAAGFLSIYLMSRRV